VLISKYRSIASEVEAAGHVPGARGLVITEVEPILLSYQFPEDKPLAWSGGLLPGVTAGLVRIRTSDGISGLGETYAGQFAPEVVQELVRYYAPMLIGEDASDIAGLWRKCYSRTLYWGRTGIAVSVLSAIEAALWDLCGKAVGLPVHRLLSDSGPPSIDTYASGGMDADDDTLRREQEGYVAAGFRASKIRIGHSADEDEHKVEVASAALGPGIGLAADAVQGSNPNAWDAATAIEVGKRLEQYGLLWYEEPCAADDIAGYVECRRALDIPIAGGETRTTAKGFVELFAAGALDIVQPDAAHGGGILEALKVTHLAQAASVQTAMHAWSSGIGVMANVHVAFGAPVCRWIEYPTVGNPLVTDLLVEQLQVVNGALVAPTAPGLGVQLTEEVHERHQYVPRSHYQFGQRRG